MRKFRCADRLRVERGTFVTASKADVQKGEFRHVALDMLQDDTVFDFDLYISPGAGKPPVLYHNKAVPFEAEHRRRLAGMGDSKLLVREEDAKALELYVERNLDRTPRCSARARPMVHTFTECVYT